jgi:hypothetical protein
MNEKILWKIQELWEKAYLPNHESSVPQSGWQHSTGCFVRVDVFTPASSEMPVMFDTAGQYYGMDQDVVIWHEKKPVYIFDNHNKALFAFLEIQQSFGNNLPIVHIDAHLDDAIPNFSPDEITESNIHETYQQSRICDFISVSQQGGLIDNVERIVTSSQFDGYVLPEQPFILSLDIDIFGPEGAYIDLEKKVAVIAIAWSKAAVVTIATSPGFIDQQFAWKIIQSFLVSGVDML